IYVNIKYLTKSAFWPDRITFQVGFSFCHIHPPALTHVIKMGYHARLALPGADCLAPFLVLVI
ncbi:MAG: hypothetical protein R3330_08385, partial [Saprospiraceae bacterium]|nr:hypothetical protein [Saprospiraceae bacterium]